MELNYVEKGSVYRIEFWDHAKYTDEPLKCIIFGEVIETNDHYSVVAWWITPSTPGDNLETVTILNSTIIESRKFKC